MWPERPHEFPGVSLALPFTYFPWQAESFGGRPPLGRFVVISVVNSVVELPPVVVNGTSASSVYGLPLVAMSEAAASEVPYTAGYHDFVLLVGSSGMQSGISAPNLNFLVLMPHTQIGLQKCLNTGCNSTCPFVKLNITHNQSLHRCRFAVSLVKRSKRSASSGTAAALRYLIRDSSILQKVLKLKVDYLIARCIDIQQSNEVERTQALRLVRKMITVNASLFPSSLTNSLIAVGNDGLQERDRMVRACIAIICELALQNPEVVALRGGLSTILKNVIDCQLSRINEALITTILHLLNHPKTRQYVRADVELEQILAPYTDFHYRHNPDTAEGQLKPGSQIPGEQTRIVAAFRSWAGIISLCKPGNSGIQSLIGVLCIPNMEIRRGLLEVLYEIFRFPLPVVTKDFTEALLSVDPSRFQESWRLSDGFVAAEAKTILPHRARSRADLVDNYLALVLSAFISNGLLEGLIEVITSSDDDVSVRATIILGELLHMANTILPHSHSHHLHCLPTLVNMAASFDISKEKRLRASAAVTCLKRFHEMKKRGPKPFSLYLDHTVQKAVASHQKRDQHMRDLEDALVMNLRDSQVLNHKENLEWNWNLIGTILKWPNVNMRNCKDEQLHRFVRRLLFFYKPSSSLYANLELDYSKAKQLTVVGCQFTEFLLESEDDGQGYLEDLVKDIVAWMVSISGMKQERSLQNNGLLTTLCQYYLLFIGTLSCHPHGVKMLEKCNVFQCLLNLCSLKNQDHLLKLAVSSLDYSRDGLARVILSKTLTASPDSCRLYATKHLRVLLRANVEFFSNWGIELLVTQLHDKNKNISTEALDVLDEACEDKANLHALIQMKPALSHLGDKGLLLLLRFLSIPKGFSYLNERGYVTKELEKWQKEYNLKYVDLIEEQLNEALTTYRKPPTRRQLQCDASVRLFARSPLWATGASQKTGCQLLEVQNVVPDLSYTVRSPSLDNWEGIKQLKAALWSLGNIGSSNWGLNLLQEENVIPDIIALAQHCEVLSIRGTCAYVLELSKTKPGCDILKQQHSRCGTAEDIWPVVPDWSSCATSCMFIIEDDPCGNSSPGPFFLYDDHEQTFFDKPLKDKDRSPFTLLAQSNKKFRSSSSSDPKTSKLRDLRRNRTVTEPWSDSEFPSMDSLGSVFKVPRINTNRLDTSVSKHVEDNGSTPSITENDLKLPKSLGSENHRDHASRERLIGDSSTTTHFKSRSLSFNTDTTTSGISSMSSSPSRETVGIDTTNMDTDCGSLSTVISTKTVKTNLPAMLHPNHLPLSKSNSVSLVPPGSSHTLPRRAQSLKAPSMAAIKTLADYHFTYTSSRDAFGYATLKRLQQQRMHPSLSHSDALASPAKDVLFTDTITMKTGSLDSRLTSSRFMKALSYASLDKEDLLSPITQNSLQRSSSVRSMVSNAAYGSSEDYIGLALPHGYKRHVKETPYFQKIAPSSDDRAAKVLAPEVGGVTGSGSKSPYQALRQQFSITEIMNSSRSDASQFLENMEDTGLQEHTDDNCLYCVGIQVLGYNGNLVGEYSRLDFPDIPYSDWCPHSIPNHLEVVSHSSKYSGISGSSDGVSQGSASSTKSTELVLGGKSIPEDTPMCRILLRKEVLRLVINLSSSVGTKGHETGLLTIKEKFPQAFDDICLYSEVSYLLAHCTFRLPSRRFIQELFQDVQFQIMHEEAEGLLAVPPKQPVLCTDAES
ncbi:unnamed protein product [Ranitomeya imitator]|uniref:RPTOR independent companion of MTOR complex 2 n=1 Tax=Ranitomeya imitator TaxID=111125 RepID=A0ABN9MFM0_9NEOB|nr:unnamed protein product [Ranitomeya imitator]